jgi:hypothetical protein
MKTIKPYQNESESLTIADLTIENRTDRVAIYGQVHLTRDKAGLADARALKAVIDQVVGVLESDSALPDKIALTNAPRAAKNPFG